CQPSRAVAILKAANRCTMRKILAILSSYFWRTHHDVPHFHGRSCSSPLGVGGARRIPRRRNGLTRRQEARNALDHKRKLEHRQRRRGYADTATGRIGLVSLRRLSVVEKEVRRFRDRV